MEWIFYIGGQKYGASFSDGVFETTNSFLKFTVNNLIENSVLVRPGYMAPARPASLASDDLAWGTISQAIRTISSDERNVFPITDSGFEVQSRES